ncbi:hypothetical protein LOD99_16206 [Oopsacas minuta]|uniref:Mannosyltransferase n=1 Tax=Oopsacas minuta TaxID=111878 RepID=A0AAV7K8E4_9METZ|nr:hypothetical protein LOD99_16206 [Oopsacas minuta]
MYKSWFVLLAWICVIYIYVCPYNKVEESFNIQAVHDLIFYSWSDLEAFDHLEFPGVVPRSFIGPLILWAQTILVSQFHIPKPYLQYYVRCMLGFGNLLALYLYVSGIAKHFGNNTAIWMLIITACQFHYLFYISRTLPNSFALVLCQLAFSGWIYGNSVLLVISTLFCVLVFRGELVLLLGVLILYTLVTKQMELRNVLKWSFVGGIIAITSTILIDSYFWDRWVWPEGEVLWYNTVLNKSSQWGTSPFLWYFYSALPRMILIALPLSILSCYYDIRCIKLLFPALLFIFLFSFLPHKELRFIIYTVPLFNAAAGRAVDYIQNIKETTGLIMRITCIGSLLISFVISICFLYVSKHNYPGGVAFSRLHDMGPGKGEVRVHISVEAAQTGVNRFGELHDNWVYSKAEDSEEDTDFMKQFSWIITTEDKFVKYRNMTHTLEEKIDGYDGIYWNRRTPFILPKIIFNTKLVIAKRIPHI